METTVEDQDIHNSLKRDRHAFINDLIFDQESDRSQKKTKITSDASSLTGLATADAADGPICTADDHLTSSSTDANIDTSEADPAPTDPSIVCEDHGSATDETPSRPSLQTLPRELRDMIYEFVAESDERIVLGRRMLEARKANNTWTLDKCFDEAVALHPLSMTCWQFRNEFQDIHHSARQPLWILLVNNFDLEQLQIFSDYIQSEEFFKVIDGDYWDEDDQWEHSIPLCHPRVSLRFQMDDDAQPSAWQLCQHVFDHKGNAPKSLISGEPFRKWLGLAEIVPRYVTRTTVRAGYRESMTLDEAEYIQSAFESLRSYVQRIPDYEGVCQGYCFDELEDAPWSLWYLEWCWFEKFYEAVKSMCRNTKVEGE